MERDTIIQRGRAVLSLEANAILKTREHLGLEFVETLSSIYDCVRAGKKLIFSGVGKNEPICEKIRATFNSTGVTAVYLDPLKALHGDLGLCDEGDLAFLFSNSGTSEELLLLNGFLRRLGVKTVAFTSQGKSPLAQSTDQFLAFHYEEEACPLQLAPTASTTAALALGDALAMVFLEMRGFSRDDFARYHPSGSLGKSLLLRVSEIMRKDDRMAIERDTCTIREAILGITKARCGLIVLIDPETQVLSGVFSDGDFRRASIRESDVMQTPVANYMTRNPVSIRNTALAVEALKLFQSHKINDIVVVDAEGRPVGIIDGQDLPTLKLV
jgi:arabinose-5-phosphate isomerase